MAQTIKRVPFLDHLRGFAFALMAIDHALHGYALNWGRFWFFQDNDRSAVFDYMYMHNNSIIIPLLFFVIGTFVIPGLEKYGLKEYLKNRFFRYVIPFLIGVPISVPILSYPKYVTNVAPGIGFFDYWVNVFFTEKLQAGPLWVVYALLLYTLIAIGVYLYLPRVFKAFASMIQWMMKRPLKGFLCVGVFSAVILGVTDLIWGAPWWVGFGKIFYMQGSRFLQQALFFFCGTAIGTLGYLEKDSLWKPLSDNWDKWFVVMAGLGLAYIWYSMAYFHDGAYDMRIVLHFYRGGDWSNIWPILQDVAPGRLIRTTLHGFFCLSQVIFLTALFHRFFKKPTPLWTSLAANGFGIFLIHEMIVVHLQYQLNDTTLPVALKFVIVASVGLGVAWGLSNLIRKLPGVRLVIGSYPKRKIP